jgi:hypothetical protein
MEIPSYIGKCVVKAFMDCMKYFKPCPMFKC